MTVSAARLSLFNLLDSSPYSVTDHLPSAPDRGVVVMIDRQGFELTSTEYHFPVRAYVPGSVPSVREAQSKVDEVIDLIDGLFDTASLVASCTVSLISDADVWSIDWVVTLYRDDF